VAVLWKPRLGLAVIPSSFVLRKNGYVNMAYPNPPQTGLKQADMTDCKKKEKIVGGPNSGYAIDPDEPCLPGYTWDPTTKTCT